MCLTYVVRQSESIFKAGRAERVQKDPPTLDRIFDKFSHAGFRLAGQFLGVDCSPLLLSESMDGPR